MIDDAATPEATDADLNERILATLEPQGDPATESEGTEPEQNTEDAKPDNPDNPEEQETEQPLYTVKVRGEEVQVPLDELLKGYSATQDYTLKTAEAAEIRRQAESEKQAAAQERAKYLEGLNRTIEMMRTMDPVLAEAAQTDWIKLSKEDPTAYVQKLAEVQARQGQLAYLEQQRNQVAAQHQQALLSTEHQRLVEKMPEWGSESERPKVVSQITQYLEGLGYTKDEINAVSDHRAFIVAREAAMYRAMKAAQKGIPQKKAAPLPQKVQTPNAATQSRPNPNMAALRKKAHSGRIDDKVDAILSIVGDN